MSASGLAKFEALGWAASGSCRPAGSGEFYGGDGKSVQRWNPSTIS